MGCEHHLHESHRPNRFGSSCSIFLFCCFCLCILFSYQVQIVLCHGGAPEPAAVVVEEEHEEHEEHEGEHEEHEIFHNYTSFPPDGDWDPGKFISREVFERYDLNTDNKIGRKEFEAYLEHFLSETVLNPEESSKRNRTKVVDDPCPSALALFKINDRNRKNYLNKDEFLRASQDVVVMLLNDCEPNCAEHCEAAGVLEEEEEELDSDTQIIIKTIFLVVIGVLTFLASILPWGMRKIKHALDLMYLGAAFASGVIIGLALSHTIPGAQEGFSTYFALAGTDDLLDAEDAAYPFAELIVGGTLIILIGIDKIIVHRGLTGHNHEESPDHGHNHMVVDLPKGGENDISKLRGGKYHAGQAWIFFVALSIHSIFDGFSLGAETTETGLSSVIIAILAHKLLDGFSLGVPVYLAKFPLWKSMSFLIFCAAMTPLGIAIAMITVEVNDGADAALVRGIFLAMSAGSFLFIALVELLPSSLADGRWAVAKWFAIVAGWGLMVLIAIWA